MFHIKPRPTDTWIEIVWRSGVKMERTYSTYMRTRFTSVTEALWSRCLVIFHSNFTFFYSFACCISYQQASFPRTYVCFSLVYMFVCLLFCGECNVYGKRMRVLRTYSVGRQIFVYQYFFPVNMYLSFVANVSQWPMKLQCSEWKKDQQKKKNTRELTWKQKDKD